jgi:hypothetical protein
MQPRVFLHPWMQRRDFLHPPNDYASRLLVGTRFPPFLHLALEMLETTELRGDKSGVIELFFLLQVRRRCDSVSHCVFAVQFASPFGLINLFVRGFRIVAPRSGLSLHIAALVAMHCGGSHRCSLGSVRPSGRVPTRGHAGREGLTFLGSRTREEMDGATAQRHSPRKCSGWSANHKWQ